MTITDIVQRSDTPLGRIFDWTVMGLIIISLITFSIDTLPDIPPALRSVFDLCESIIVGLFTLEYCSRVATTPRGERLRFIFSFYGIIDVMAVIPFYLSAGVVDLRALRIVRLFRVLRILKIVRYNEAIRRFGKALVRAKEELALFAAATAIVLYLSAVGIYYFERDAQPEAFPSIIHSLWWAVTALTGYGGNVSPVSGGGQAIYLRRTDVRTGDRCGACRPGGRRPVGGPP